MSIENEIDNDTDEEIDEDKQALENIFSGFETIMSTAKFEYVVESDHGLLATFEMSKLHEHGFKCSRVSFEDDQIAVTKVEQEEEESKEEKPITKKIEDIVKDDVEVVDEQESWSTITLVVPEHKDLILSTVQRQDIANLGWKVDFIGGVSKGSVHVYLKEIDD